jgi:hypothetical protein
MGILGRRVEPTPRLPDRVLGSVVAIMSWLRSRPWLLTGLALFPLSLWWLAWYPGFYSSDSIDQMTQVATGRYAGIHPAAHTLYLSLLSGGGDQPGLIPFVQVVALTALLVYAARTLHRLGTPAWAVVGTSWLIGLSPAVGPTTNAVWKDIPFGIAMLWAWVELVQIKRDSSRWGAWIRLGVALSIVGLFRQNGLLTVLPLLAVIGWSYRRALCRPAVTVGVIAGLVALVVGPLYSAVGAVSAPTDPATVFLADLAASFHEEPETFTGEDLELMEQVAPLSLWRDRYTCYESTPLIFDPQFDLDQVDRVGSEFLDLERRVLLRDPDSVLGHRLCSASYLVVPPQPEDAYFHRPPYDIPSNTLGLRRSPISDRAFAFADAVFRWSEIDSRLWLTWRPGLIILPALAVSGWLAVRRSRWLLPQALFLLHLLNLAATSPSPEFRYAYPLYLIGLMSFCLIPIERQRSRAAGG